MAWPGRTIGRLPYQFSIMNRPAAGDWGAAVRDASPAPAGKSVAERGRRADADSPGKATPGNADLKVRTAEGKMVSGRRRRVGRGVGGIPLAEQRKRVPLEFSSVLHGNARPVGPALMNNI